MNSTILVGNLTADPKLHISERDGKQKKRATFSMAINEGQGENERTHFVNLTAFDSLAENIVESWAKGMRVIVGARLNTYKQVVTINGEEKSLTMVAYVATHAGPEIRFATAKVTKVVREGNGNGAAQPAPNDAAQSNGTAGEASSNGSDSGAGEAAPAAVAASAPAVAPAEDDDF